MSAVTAEDPSPGTVRSTTGISGDKVARKGEGVRRFSIWEPVEESGKQHVNVECLKPDSVEGRYVADMGKAVYRLQELFAEVLVDASENYQSAEVQKNTTEGGVKYQARKAGNGITQAEIDTIQKIGRISINAFRSSEISAVKRYAEQYWNLMGIKSPFFRAWFGDWRANDRTTSVEIANQLGGNRGVQRNDDTGWDIQVSGMVFNETNRHTDSYNVAARPYLPYINDIVKKAVLLDTYGIDPNKAKSPNTLLMHSMYAVSDIGNGPEVIKLYVEEMNNPTSMDTSKRAYQLQNIEKYQPQNGSSQKSASSKSSATGTIRTVADLYGYVKSKDSRFSPNPSSKIVNVDGTPKVMYHGTRLENGDFYVFDSSKATKKGGLGLRAMGKGNYFTAKKLDGTERYGSRVIPAYLDIKNPFVYNGGNDFRTQVTNGLGLDPRIDDDALQQEMRNRGYDGVVQYDSYGEVSIAVTFDSNQIKSATDNIGTFDPTNPDIRYSDRDTESVSNRSLLADALESVAQTDWEKQKLTEYKGKIQQIEAQEKKLLRREPAKPFML